MTNVASAQAALAVLGGGGGSRGNGLSAMTNYRMLETSREQRFEAYTKQPTVQRELAYFAEKITGIESADDLLEDWQLKTFVLKAFGLEELERSDHMVKRILTDDLENQDEALAYRMQDPRFPEMAVTLRLDQGTAKIKSPATIQEVAQRYLLNGFETQVGQDSIATRQALYFERKIGKAANIFQVMADPTLREVARVAGGLPTDISRLDFDKQAALYEKSIEVDRLKDPDYVKELVERFLVRADMESGAGTAAANGIVSLFQPGGGFNVNLLV